MNVRFCGVNFCVFRSEDRTYTNSFLVFQVWFLFLGELLEGEKKGRKDNKMTKMINNK